MVPDRDQDIKPRFHKSKAMAVTNKAELNQVRDPLTFVRLADPDRKCRCSEKSKFTFCGTPHLVPENVGLVWSLLFSLL